MGPKLAMIMGVLLGAMQFAGAQPANIVIDHFTDKSRDRSGAFEADWRKAQNLRELTVIEELSPTNAIPRYWLKLVPEGIFPTCAGVFDLHPGTPDGAGVGATLGGKVGDQVVLSLEFRFVEATSPGAEIRLGLFNNGGTPSNEHGWQLYQDDVGYYLSMPIGGGTGGLWKDYGKDGTICGGADKIPMKGMTGTPIPPLGNKPHQATLTLTRDQAGIKIAGAIDGVMFLTGIDTPAPEDPKDPPGLYTVFHEIGLTLGNTRTNSLLITDVILRAQPSDEKKPVPSKSPKPAAPTPGAAVEAAPAASGSPWLWLAGTGALLAVIIGATWKLARMTAPKGGAE